MPAAASKTWATLPDVPAEWSIKFALLLLDEKLVADAIAVLERAKHGGPPSFELAFNLGGAYLVNGDLPRALDAYDLALTLQPRLAARPAAGGRDRREARRAGALVVVLDPRAEARRRRSGSPSGIRPRLSEDGSARRRRAGLDQSRGIEARRRCRISTRWPPRRWGSGSSRRPQRLLEPLLRTRRTIRICSTRWARSCTRRDASRRRPSVS